MAWAQLRRQGETFLRDWEPSWAADHFSRKAFRNRVYWAHRAREEGRAVALFLIRREDARLVGAITLDNIRRGPSQSAQVGYWIGEAFARQGYMSEALGRWSRHAFARARPQPDRGGLPARERRLARAARAGGVQVRGRGAELPADQRPLAQPCALRQPASGSPRAGWGDGMSEASGRARRGWRRAASTRADEAINLITLHILEEKLTSAKPRLTRRCLRAHRGARVRRAPGSLSGRARHASGRARTAYAACRRGRGVMPQLNPADDALLDRLRTALGADAVRPPEPRHLEEPRGRSAGRAAVLLPARPRPWRRRSRSAPRRGSAIVPDLGRHRAGRRRDDDRGAAAGAVCRCERMNRIREVDAVSAA